MNSPISHQTLLAINSTEWLNLCARGSIRMHKHRSIQTSVFPTPKEMEKVFASAPFTKLSSSVDLFVLVLRDTWSKDAPKHRAFPSEVLMLKLNDVLSHHPVAEEHLGYYSNLGTQCGVTLDRPIFERDWTSWVLNETYKSAIEAAEILQGIFGFMKSSEVKRSDKYKWEEIAKLVLRPNEEVKKKPSHAESLLRGVREISDAVAAARDSEQFYIACAIEWIEFRTGKDPMKKKMDRIALMGALAKAKEKPIGAPSDETLLVLSRLANSHPKAFTEELSPLTISYAVRLLTESRSKKIQPSTAAQIFNSVDRNNSASTFLAFLLATSLGIELTNKLVIAFSHVDFVDMDWNVTN
jgi:hypothetical protein